MRRRQWILLVALVATLLSTWWAARIEEPPVAPFTAERTASSGHRDAALERVVEAGEDDALAVGREPWPLIGGALMAAVQSAVPRADREPSEGVPVPPPLPFRFVGAIEEGSVRTVILMEGEDVHVVRVRERIDDRYRIERITTTQIEFIYLPLQYRQVLEILGAQDAGG